MDYFEKSQTLLEQKDPPEYRHPACPDQVFHNGAGQFTVRSYLHDPYQAGLVKEGWLERLIATIRTYPELYDKTLVLQLRPKFNKAYLESGLAYPIGWDDEKNQHKNRFLLDLTWALPDSSPMDVSYHYELMYNPRSREYPFDLLGCDVRYTWRTDTLGDDLEQRLLGLGILKEVVLSAGKPDPELATLFMEGTLEYPEFVLVGKHEHVLSVAIDELGSFPSDIAVWQNSRSIVQPVLVRDRKLLEGFRENLYRGLKAKKLVIFEGVGLAVGSRLIQKSVQSLLEMSRGSIGRSILTSFTLTLGGGSLTCALAAQGPWFQAGCPRDLSLVIFPQAFGILWKA